MSWLSSFTELGIVSSSSRGRVDFRSIPIGMYVLTLYLVQLTYPVVLPIRQCTFPYGYHTVSHHIGHTIRGLTETRRELRELSSQDRTRTCMCNFLGPSPMAHYPLVNLASNQFRHLTIFNISILGSHRYFFVRLRNSVL